MEPTGLEVRKITRNAQSKIEAIRDLRAATGLSLAIAKPLVERWWKRSPVTDEMVEAAIRNCPMPYEIAGGDPEAFRRMLEAVVQKMPNSN